MATVISDTPDGPVETDLEALTEDQLRMLAGEGVEEAQRLWLQRRGAGPGDWTERASNQMGRRRGQA